VTPVAAGAPEERRSPPPEERRSPPPSPSLSHPLSASQPEKPSFGPSTQQLAKENKFTGMSAVESGDGKFVNKKKPMATATTCMHSDMVQATREAVYSKRFRSGFEALSKRIRADSKRIRDCRDCRGWDCNDVGCGSKAVPAGEFTGIFDILGVEAALKANEASWIYESGGKRIVEVTMDSGAAVTVVPRGASSAAIAPTTKPNCNHFRVANGAKIPNLGEQVLAGATANGRGLRFKAQVADVTKPLASVQELCDSGCTVTFGPDRFFIRDSRSGKEIEMRKKNGQFVVDLHIDAVTGSSAPFRRQEKVMP